MKIVFLGATKFSESILLYLIENNITIDLILTIPEKFGISYSDKKIKNFNFSDLAETAKKNNIPYHSVESKEGNKISDYYDTISGLSPDVILVMGWYYMIPRKVRELAKFGAWGIHASLLPEYAGGAPLVWAIIEGRKKTGVTLFRLEDGVDDGDIIAQSEFEVGEDETIKEVYDKATEKSKEILLDALKNITKISFRKQDKSMIKIYPQRRPDDGEIDLHLPAKKIYDFIRAQSSPYPGAFIKTVDNKKIFFEKARIGD